MRLQGKRWIYAIDERTLYVENAWSWTLWCQERVTMDGRVLASAEGWSAFYRKFQLAPSQTGLPQSLHVHMYSGLFRVHCHVQLGDVTLTPDAVEYGVWRAPRGDWPGPTPSQQGS